MKRAAHLALAIPLAWSSLTLARPEERRLSPEEAQRKVMAIWSEMAPKLAKLGLGPVKVFGPDGDGGFVKFSLATEHRDGTYRTGAGIPMDPGESQWWISGEIDWRPSSVDDEAYSRETWFDLAPGGRAVLTPGPEEGWLVERLDPPPGPWVYYPTGGGRARFRRGRVRFTVELLRAGRSVTKSKEGNRDFLDIRKQETKAIFDAAIPDIQALCQKLYALIPPSAWADTGSTSPVTLTLLDPNPIYDSRRPVLGQDRSVLPGFSASYLEVLSQLLKSDRVGATADGTSLLLVRATVPEAGKVTLSLTGADAGGTLHAVLGRKWTAKYPFDDAGATSIDVDAAPLNGSETIAALALFKPPADFGSARGARVFTLEATFTAREPSKAKGAASIPLTLVRPPVVLVHGTYDNPTDCWTKIGAGAPPGNTISMLDRLKQEAFRVFLADYKESSGSSSSVPSTFEANQQMLWAAPGGIHEALEAFRRDRFAATRADVICHSLGGVLARVYIRGSLPDPRLYVWRWGHIRRDNYLRGDVNRLVTISSTHRGSEVMELFDAYSKYADTKWNLSSFWMEIFMGYVDVLEQRITTGAPVDQIPGSAALRAVGATRVRAHAISCIASEEDLDTYGGAYRGRAEKLWGASTAESLELGVGVHLRNPQAAERLVAAKAAEQALAEEISRITVQLAGSGSSYPAARTVDPALVQRSLDLQAKLAKTKLKNALELRTVVFRGENDCTVSLKSSSGGLAPPYQTTIGHVLHGYASQYPSVQNRVLELLRSEGDTHFAPDGFPDTWAPEPGKAATWGQILVPPATDGR